MNTKNRYFFWFDSRVRGNKWRDVNWQVLSCPAAWLHGKLADLTHYKMLSYRSSVRGGAAFSPTPQLSGPYRDHSHTNMCVRFFILYMLRQFLHSNIKRIKKNCWMEEVSSFVQYSRALPSCHKILTRPSFIEDVGQYLKGIVFLKIYSPPRSRVF